MISALKFKVTFSTGRTIEQDLTFATGLTAIVGANEAGKSLILEMIRYALFGTAALRGASSEYKAIAADLTFRLKGLDYQVVRKNGSSHLYGCDVDIIHLASGTKPVNQAILRLLGYDLDVFDVANNCAQGQVEALGSMKPAERKRMVDQTIGLTALDDLSKVIGDKCNAAKKAADAIGAALREPQALVPPVAYRPAADVRRECERLDSLRAELQAVRGWLSTSPRDPGPVPKAPCPEGADVLAADVRRRNQIDLALRTLKGAASALRRPRLSLAQIEALETQLLAYRSWSEASAWLTRDPAMPDYTPAMKRSVERALLEHKIEALTSGGHLTCPSCDYSWPVEADTIAELERQLEAYSDVEAVTSLTIDQVERLERAHKRWLEDEPKRAAYREVPKVDHPGVSEADLVRARRDLEDGKKLDELEPQIALLETELSKMSDRTADLAARQRYEAAIAHYGPARAAYDAYLAEKAIKETRMTELAGVEEQLQALEKLFSECMGYESNLQLFEREMISYKSLTDEANGLRKKEKQYDATRSALKVLRSRVKEFLVPSLNKVASHLLSQMTSGARNSIEVDQDFEIKVDGQGLHTLSGSAKAVANLAVRIGLGQVLTNKTFSVFMGDEIDASMDDDRAEATAQCLQNLTKGINQILLVSHKRPEADQYVEV